MAASIVGPEFKAPRARETVLANSTFAHSLKEPAVFAKIARGSDFSAASSARDAILLEQLPQVQSIARNLHRRLPGHVPLEDLVQAGFLGLMDALDKYDARKSVQLKHYARFRIYGAILDSLREMDWSPRNLRKKARQLTAAQYSLSAQLGRLPDENELAAELGASLPAFRAILRELRGLDLTSLDASTLHLTGEKLFFPFGASEDESPFEQCLRSEMRHLLAVAINELSERERQVLTLYYFEELTLKEVGALLGVGEARVSQIRSQAVSRLQEQMQQRLH